MDPDYGRLLEVMQEEVEWAMKHRCLVEDAQGRETEHMISGISLHILDKSILFHTFQNSYEVDKGLESKTEMLIRVYKENQHKVIRGDFIVEGVPLHPDNFRIFFRQRIDALMRIALNLFFSSKKAKNKYFIKSKDEAEVYVEDVRKIDCLDPSLIEKVVGFSKMIFRMPQVKQAEAGLAAARDINIVVDSEGRKILEQKSNITCNLATLCVNSQRFHLSLSHSFFYPDKESFLAGFEQDVLEHQESILCIDKLTMLNSGFYPMLFTPHTTNVLFHEALLGHLLSGDLIVNDDATIFKHVISKGKPVASSLPFKALGGIKITVDPFRAGKFGSYKFDTEGVRAKKMVLMDRGRIKQFLHSRNSAARMKTKSNGHARAGGFMSMEGDVQIPESRISHFIIKRHSRKRTEDLIGEIEAFCRANGYEFYLKVNGYGGEVDPETGNFTMDLGVCEKVYLDGRREAVMGGNISGSPYDLLSCIQDFGSEMKTVSGQCGSMSGWIPVSAEVPWLFFYGNYVSGRELEPDPYFDLVRDKVIPEDF